MIVVNFINKQTALHDCSAITYRFFIQNTNLFQYIKNVFTIIGSVYTLSIINCNIIELISYI